MPIIGALIAVFGLYLMTDPGGGGLNRGDAITLVTAIAYALYIIILEVLTRRYPYQDLVVMQFLPLAFLFAPAAIAEGEPIRWGSGLVWALLLTGPVAALTVYLQNRYQRYTTATRAAVILAGEPVFAAIFSYFLLGEVLSWSQAGGALFILIGILIALKR
jgi:drug/metabolite transporter (DMT)-like permease